MPLPPTAKPRPDFPLFRHASGQWAKKIRGRLHYFGKDAEAALAKYLDQKDDLQAGRTPRIQGKGLTIRDLGNEFLNAKRARVETGELSLRTFQEYHGSVVSLSEILGKTRLVSDLFPEDFEKLRAKLAKTRGAVSLGNEIQRIRTCFKFGFESELMDRPARFGQSFRKPDRKALRKARAASGTRMMEARELRLMLDAAKQPLRAMMLLALNGGFGQTDLACLPLKAIDLESGWIDFPRPKTGVPRRCPLWPETIAALREAMEQRPTPKHGTDPELVFITKYGKQWCRFDAGEQGDKRTNNDAIGAAFAKLAKAKGCKVRGSFYNLRHVFRTVADESKDQPAVDHVMGHCDESMASRYREKIADSRLLAVVQVVHDWLFASESAGDPTGTPDEPDEPKAAPETTAAERPQLRIVG